VPAAVGERRAQRGVGRRGIDTLAAQPLRVVQSAVVALAGVAQQGDDAAGLAVGVHARCQLQAGDEVGARGAAVAARSEEHTSELQSLMRISYAVLCLKK